MARWNLVIADDTDRHVRSYLARTGGKKGDLSRFVDRAVRQAIFWETVESVWERNRHLSSEEVQRVADEAVAEARAEGTSMNQFVAMAVAEKVSALKTAEFFA